MGILILFAAQILSSFMGIYLESTYRKYGSNWREGLFYTVPSPTYNPSYNPSDRQHFLGIPFFIPLLPRIIRDFHTLSLSPLVHIPPLIAEIIPFPLHIPRHLFFLLLNVLTQYLCVRGVNRLSAISTALTITIILNLRKFTSLALSVAIFGNKLATGVKIGAILVGTGAAWYAYESRGRAIKRYRSKPLLPAARFPCGEGLNVVVRMAGYCQSRGVRRMRCLSYQRDRTQRKLTFRGHHRRFR